MKNVYICMLAALLGLTSWQPALNATGRKPLSDQDHNIVRMGLMFKIALRSFGKAFNLKLDYKELNDLSTLNCDEMNLSNSPLHDLNFSGASFKKGNLSGSDLSRSQLTGANCEGTDLSRADLTDTDITNTKFNAATNLNKAKGLTFEGKCRAHLQNAGNIPWDGVDHLRKCPSHLAYRHTSSTDASPTKEEAIIEQLMQSKPVTADEKISRQPLCLQDLVQKNGATIKTTAPHTKITEDEAALGLVKGLAEFTVKNSDGTIDIDSRVIAEMINPRMEQFPNITRHLFTHPGVSATTSFQYSKCKQSVDKEDGKYVLWERCSTHMPYAIFAATVDKLKKSEQETTTQTR